jgi:transposase-like protein
MSQSCPKCGWSNIRHSRKSGVVDRALSVFLLVPYRCRDCRYRFFQFPHATVRILAIALCVIVLLIGFRIVSERRGLFQKHPTPPSSLGGPEAIR